MLGKSEGGSWEDVLMVRDKVKVNNWLKQCVIYSRLVKLFYNSDAFINLFVHWPLKGYCKGFAVMKQPKWTF